MDLQGIIDACNLFGCRIGHPYWSEAHQRRFISVSCPLAPYRHNDPTDHNKSCSISINDDGPSSAKCHSFNCEFKGSFFFLLQLVVDAEAAPTEEQKDLLRRVGKAEEVTLESAAAHVAKKIEVAQAEAKQVLAAPPTRRSRLFDRDCLDESALDEFRGSVPRYVLNRGATIDSVKKWELGYDRRLGRLIFPCRRFDGALIGITGRILPTVAQKIFEETGEEPTKYHNYSGLNKTRYLYGAHFFKRDRPVILVEGPMDAIITAQNLEGHVEANIGATLGQGFSPEHRATVRSCHPPGIYLFMDGDPPGINAANKVEAALHSDAQTYVMLTPLEQVLNKETGETVWASTDPGSMTPEETRYALDNAVPVLDEIDWEACERVRPRRHEDK